VERLQEIGNKLPRNSGQQFYKGDCKSAEKRKTNVKFTHK
jgi:hypothetical protein